MPSQKIKRLPRNKGDRKPKSFAPPRSPSEGVQGEDGFLDLLVQPGPRLGPQPIGRSWRKAEQLRHFRKGRAAEEVGVRS
jgi:hypothetical protein